ncbi:MULTISPECIES: competence type IV pilus minor pilin ComGD [Bacillus]|uniref:competence type IV pilus minor pilin ComGD n=1 Tax=Bacillus TaxID=1386 RepID=UPI000379F671|nr:MULTISPECIES: competence type IV pilus minor pilin ComGD [Bacillus]
MLHKIRATIHSIAAFTLIELLIVLSIFIMLLSISIITLPKISEKRDMEHFLLQLSKDLHYSQAYAINRKSILFFTFDFKKKCYFVKDGPFEKDIIILREIPETIKIEEGSLGREIMISLYGHVSVFGTWYLSSEHYRYVFTIQIGRGRHYYAEL